MENLKLPAQSIEIIENSLREVIESQLDSSNVEFSLERGTKKGEKTQWNKRKWLYLIISNY